MSQSQGITKDHQKKKSEGAPGLIYFASCLLAKTVSSTSFLQGSLPCLLPLVMHAREHHLLAISIACCRGNGNGRTVKIGYQLGQMESARSLASAALSLCLQAY